MASLKELTTHPAYDAAATRSSKGTILIFVATFGYLLFFSDASPGLLGAAAFVVIGMFVVSLVIAMPLFLLKLKVARLGIFFSIASTALTVFLTRAAYLWMFAQEPIAGEPFVVSCSEPIPEFTLGYESKPSETDVQALCACIFGNLNTWEKATARALAEGREQDISTLHMDAFPSRFGQAARGCGAMEL